MAQWPGASSCTPDEGRACRVRFPRAPARRRALADRARAEQPKPPQQGPHLRCERKASPWSRARKSGRTPKRSRARNSSRACASHTARAKSPLIRSSSPGPHSSYRGLSPRCRFASRTCGRGARARSGARRGCRPRRSGAPSSDRPLSPTADRRARGSTTASLVLTIPTPPSSSSPTPSGPRWRRSPAITRSNSSRKPAAPPQSTTPASPHIRNRAPSPGAHTRRRRRPFRASSAERSHVPFPTSPSPTIC